MNKINGVFVVIAAMFMVSPAYAAMTDPLIEGAKLCTRYLPRYEREYGIPTHLLSAIASTESGRFHKGLNISVPWPWTINAEGKGYYFDSKAEALAAARKMRRRGIKSMDVGCMQVNLFHHPKAFSSLEAAFEPKNNIAYAASFLRNLYEESKSWKTAASSYHSKTPSRGKKYVGGVYDRWYTIVARLREAKLRVGNNKNISVNPDKPVASAIEHTKTARAKIIKPKSKKQKQKIAVLPEQRGTKYAMHKTPHMNSIKVTRQEDKRENGIIVVRPAIKIVDSPVSVEIAAQNQKAEILTVATIEPVAKAKIIHVGDSKNTGEAKIKSGPRFIFDN